MTSINAPEREGGGMTKIPEDIIKAGRRCYDGLGRGSVSDSEHIARAILAERERCAKTAERFCSEREPWSDGGTRILRAVYGPDIAAAIRKGSD